MTGFDQTMCSNVLLVVLSCCLNFIGVNGQYNPNGGYYYNGDPYQYPSYPYNNDPYNPNPQNPYDRGYRTYVYNDRRYGQNPNTLDPNRGYPGDPRFQGQDPRFSYDQEGNPEPMRPGILGGWREDLQGRQREDSIVKDRDIFVTTSHGDVQGFKVYLYDNPDPDSLYRPGLTIVEREQGTTSVFLGIPYAQPPVDDGRFKPPRWHKGWKHLAAVDFGPACPQPAMYTGATKGIRDVHEDCLYLNVFSPSIEGVSQKFPVMLYIHGGDFVRGASNLFPGHILATFYKVVVVTFNYRLGALGFLSTADINSPGNYGILDMAMALKWVYQNIDAFNGDRHSITLFGPGAGAASAGILMVMPETKHMVDKVIAQSGSALADWSLIVDKYRAQNTSRVFGQLIGCSIESSWKLVHCLKQSRSYHELGNAEFPPHVGLFPWAPVIDMNLTMPYYEGWNEGDWTFLKETPEQLIKKGHFNQGLKYMSSITMREAADFIWNNESLARKNYEVDEDFFDQKVRELVLRYNYTLNPNGTYEAIKYMYTHWPDPHNKTHIREKYIELLSDFLFVSPNDKIIKLLVEKRVPVYMYVLNTTVESYFYPEWRKTPHDIEHYLLSGAPFMDVEFLPSKLKFKRDQWTNNDRNMSHFFMKAYSDFARYGNPSRTQILGLHFEKAEHGLLKYLNLNTTFNSTIMWNYRQSESAFWSYYLPTVVGELVPTYPPTTEFWWEPSQPLQIAFWSMSTLCLILVVLLVVCCMLWRNAKRQQDRFYNGDIFMVPDADTDLGIENSRPEMELNEYTDKPRLPPTGGPIRSNSASSFRSGSAVSLKDAQSVPSSSPNGEPRKGTPIMQTRKSAKTTKQPLIIPQTDV